MQPPAPPPGGGEQWGQQPGGSASFGGGYPSYGNQPPPGYSQYGRPNPYMSHDHPQGTTILVLGILSLAVCQILGPFAWSMGSKAIKEIDANPEMYSNRGTVNAGRICGMVSTILLIITLGIVVLAIAVAAGSS